MTVRKSLGTACLGVMLIGASAAFGCGGGGDDEPGAIIEWVTTPATACERGETLEASWTVTSEYAIAQSILLVCEGTVPECGIADPAAITYSAVGTPTSGVYSASIELMESGVYTFVAFADTGEGAYVSPPMGVVVDQRAYPAGPYGYRASDIIQNFSLQGYYDDNKNGNPFDDTPRDIFLEEFFSGQDLEARVLLLNVSAGWCSVCQDEARYLKTIYNEYKAKGGRFYTVLFQDDAENPAELDDVESWGTYFQTTWPHAADPTDSLSPYFPAPEVPLNVFVDLSTMKIVEVHTGFDGSYARQILDTYVN